MSMQAASVTPRRLVFQLVSLGIIGIALAIGMFAWHQAVLFPSTDDAAIDADIVHVASEVSGRIIDIPVTENLRVVKGQILFRIDPVPYQLAVDQAHADLALAEAQLATQRRAVATQQAAAVIAAAQTTRAMTNLELATRTVNRLSPLAAQGYVPTEQLDQAESAARDAATSLQQARDQAAAAVTAIDTVAATEAAVAARRAVLAIARRHLADTVVRAPSDGLVVGLTESAGEMIAPAQALFTLINSDAWYAVGNFRETQLGTIAVGDCATVYSMIDRRHPIAGVVQGIGWGVLDQERVELPFAVPYVERSLNWVRVAQRFPVRVLLKDAPPRLARLGASAVIEIRHGAACR
jgi:membrane fusion protein, multidrug efflux system